MDRQYHHPGCGVTGGGQAAGTDILLLPQGVAPSDVVVLRGWNPGTRWYDDLVLRHRTTNQEILVANYFTKAPSDPSYKAESIRFSDGNQWTANDVLARLD